MSRCFNGVRVEHTRKDARGFHWCIWMVLDHVRGGKEGERMARTSLVTPVHLVMGRVLSACLGVKGGVGVEAAAKYEVLKFAIQPGLG